MPDEATREDRPETGAGTGAEEAREERSPEETAERPAETALERAERERDEYLANWQRARADYQNLKRRTLEDLQAAVRRERTALLEETLIVLDYLDMALAAPCESEEARNLQIGVQMTRDQLWTMLERQEVSPIPAEGAFDPALHQAVATVESTDVAPGTITEVVRRGFLQGNAVLRHAQVKVATAPDPTGSAGSAEAEAGAEPEEGERT